MSFFNWNIVSQMLLVNQIRNARVSQEKILYFDDVFSKMKPMRDTITASLIFHSEI